MNPYNRLLLHRLADIFGFSHQSIGEGDNRHLILERCPETSIPSILVSDLLWQYDESQSPTSQLLSKRQESPAELKAERRTSQISLEEREAAYLAARERIFSINGGEKGGTNEPMQQKPRSNPVVARRMIAHALGQRIDSEGGYAEQSEERNSEASSSGLLLSERKVSRKQTSPKSAHKDNRTEHMDAAKRMFAHALGGFSSTRNGIMSKCSEIKKNQHK